MYSPKILMIGAGNMGQSIIGGLIKHGFPAESITACNHAADKLTAIKTSYQVKTTLTFIDAIAKHDVIIFAIKPKDFENTAKTAASAIAAYQPLVLSIAAGIRMATLESWLGKKTAIVRTMPNTPTSVGYGVTGAYANAIVSNDQRALTDRLLKALGLVAWVENENLLNTITAVSGSGPAYFFYIMAAMEKAAVKYGLMPDMARKLVAQTALGAAEMARQSDATLSTLQQQVTSKGGTTEQGIRVFEQHQMDTMMLEVMTAVKEKSEEMSKSYDNSNN